MDSISLYCDSLQCGADRPIKKLPDQAAKGRLDTVTNGRFQVSELNDSCPAMNLKSGRSPGDPQETLTPHFRMAAKPIKQAFDSSVPTGTTGEYPTLS